MKAPSAATRRQIYLLTALGIVLILAVVKWGGKGPAAAPAPGSSARRAAGPSGVVEEDRPPGPGGARARAEKKIAPEDVPFINREMLEAPRARRGEDERNIFDVREPTKRPLPTPTPGPPPPPAPGSAAFIGPLPPPPPTPTPVPPQVSFKFIGTFGPKEQPIAVLVMGDQLVNARSGDVVFEHFILRNVGYESVDIGFVGYPPSVRTRLGITS